MSEHFRKDSKSCNLILSVQMIAKLDIYP